MTDVNNNETVKYETVICMDKNSLSSPAKSSQSDNSMINLIIDSSQIDRNGNERPLSFPFTEDRICQIDDHHSLKPITNADSTNSIIEIKMTDNETSIIIYKNDTGKVRNTTISDKRKLYKVKRSKTADCISNTLHNSVPSSTSNSNGNLTDSQKNLSQNTSSTFNHYTSSTNIIYASSQDSESHNKNLKSKVSLKKKMSKKMSKLISCFRRLHSCKSDVTDEIEESSVDETVERQLEWQFNFDKFDNITFISSGAEGSVYTALLNGTTVALKKMSKTKNPDIEHLLKLDHVNIIKFLGISISESCYIVMEYCSEGQLYHWLHRDADVSPQDVCSWANQICCGMAYLHDNDIIHRDLKSPNVLINENKILKIIDFGFGKSCGDNIKLNSFVGTFAWMAPEIIREEGYSKKVDIWSFGVVVWELITREIPYYGVETVAIIYGVGNNCLNLPIFDSFPKGIKALLGLCWKRSSDSRPSFNDILNDFDLYFKSILSFDCEQFKTFQADWTIKTESCFKQMSQARISVSKIEAGLIRRRIRELNDARDIKEHYNQKVRRADKLISLLNKCLLVVESEKRKNDREWRLIQDLRKSLEAQVSKEDYLQNFSSLRDSPLNPSTDGRNVKVLIENKPRRKTDRHSMMESSVIDKNKSFVRRKHSAPLSKDRPSVSKKNSSEQQQPVKVKRKTSKIIPRNGSKSCEALNDWNKSDISKTKKNIRNSNPIQETILSSLPTYHKTQQIDRQIGMFNPSFDNSDDSVVEFRSLSKVNSGYHQNLQQFLYFGPSASIADLNLTSDSDPNSTHDSSVMKYNNLLQDSITEYPQMEEDSGRSSKSNDDFAIVAELDETCYVHLREISGRKNRHIAEENQNSLDNFNSSLMSDSLGEKEKMAQKIMKPYGFIVDMAEDNSLKNFVNFPSNQIESKYRKRSKTSFEGGNISMWSPQHKK